MKKIKREQKYVCCPMCNGDGHDGSPELVRVENKYDPTCPMCRGSGGLALPFNDICCPECDGDGTVLIWNHEIESAVDDSCPKCSGEGWVWTGK